MNANKSAASLDVPPPGVSQKAKEMSKNLAEVAAPWMPWVIGGAVTSFSLVYGGLAATGRTSRLGPLRALVLGFQSRLMFRPCPPSIRAQDMRELKNRLDPSIPNQYVIVEGPKGIGKSTLLNHALAKTYGLVEVDVDPNVDVVKETFHKIARTNRENSRAEASARRVIAWHRFWFWPLEDSRPTVILRVREKPVGGPHATLASAARKLAEAKLRVIIDASTNSLDPQVLSTTREDVLSIGPMTENDINSVPEFKATIATLEKVKLKQLLYGVIGGVPSLYEGLYKQLQNQVKRKLTIKTNWWSRLYNSARVCVFKAMQSFWTSFQFQPENILSALEDDEIRDVVLQFLAEELIKALRIIEKNKEAWETIFFELETHGIIKEIPKHLKTASLPKCLRESGISARPANATFKLLFETGLWRSPVGIHAVTVFKSLLEQVDGQVEKVRTEAEKTGMVQPMAAKAEDTPGK